jgi:hypothetical protein
MRRLALALLLPAVLALPTGAAAYPWPFKPFDQQHPIRGFFGDPRTVFGNTVAQGGIDGNGFFSFHQGVDIAAPNGTPIYSVSDGRAHYLGAHVLDVLAGHGVLFQYFHIIPVVGEKQRVRKSKTILGYVQPPFGHVHLTEIDRTRVVNPLQPGHLTPYRDTTRPRIAGIVLRNAAGAAPEPICGRVQILVQASDEPPLPVPGPFDGLPVAPARVSWRLTRADGKVVTQWRDAANFTRRLPPARDFWTIYARGTYQNDPRFGSLQFPHTSGRYLFQLAAGLDTRHLQNGRYLVFARVADERGNASVRSVPFVVDNAGPCANQGTAPTLPPVLIGRGEPGGGSEEPPG